MGELSKKRVMIYISEEANEALRRLEFYKRKKKSPLVEEMILEAYRKWEQEETKSQPAEVRA